MPTNCYNKNLLKKLQATITENNDGTITVYKQDGTIFVDAFNRKPCCEVLGYKFNIDNQKCYYSIDKYNESISEIDVNKECITKLTYHPVQNDGAPFTYEDNETCELNISLNYLLKFNCDVFEKVCDDNTIEIDKLQTIIKLKESEIKIQKTECNSYSPFEFEAQFNKLCTLIKYKNIKNTPIKLGPSINSDTDIYLCLTDIGTELWYEILSLKENGFSFDYGCDTNNYDNFDVENFIVNVNELTEEPNIYYNQTIDNKDTCAKKAAYDRWQLELEKQSKCADELSRLDSELTELKTKLDKIKNPDSKYEQVIKNLENLKLYFDFEVETEVDSNKYETVISEPMFEIGEGRLMEFIIERGSETGISIYDNNGVLIPPYDVKGDNIPTTECLLKRDSFTNVLYHTQYKGIYDEPISIIDLKRILSGWYQSKWLDFEKSIDFAQLEPHKGKKIRFSIRIINCCLDLCVLTDNIKMDKSCDKVSNENIFIAKSPGFEIEKVLDNKKSWVAKETRQNRPFDLLYRETNYDVNDYRLIVNTKEIDLEIDTSNAIEEDMLSVLDCLITGLTHNTINLTDKITSGLDNINNVDELRKALISELIDAKNRQSINIYGTLKLLHEKYLGYYDNCNKATNKFTYESMENFSDVLGIFWTDLIEQFVPSTTIWESVNVYRNTIFDQQKYEYRTNNIYFCNDAKNLGFSNVPEDIIKPIGQTTDVEVIKIILKDEVVPETLDLTTLNVEFQTLSQSDETPRSNSTEPLKLNISIGTTQTFGLLTKEQLNDRDDIINILNSQTSNSFLDGDNSTECDTALIMESTCSPQFLGAVIEN